MTGDDALSVVVDGESVFVTHTRRGTLVSSYDPMQGLSADYNSKSGYEYTAADLKVRHHLKGSGMGRAVASWEASGKAKPLALRSEYKDYIRKWGTNKSFWFGAEYYMPELLPGDRDILSDGQRALSGATKNPHFNPDFNKVESPIKSRWNRYQHANKGSGKSVKQMAKERKKLLYGE